jgi:hypothetical protein
MYYDQRPQSHEEVKPLTSFDKQVAKRVVCLEWLWLHFYSREFCFFFSQQFIHKRRPVKVHCVDVLCIVSSRFNSEPSLCAASHSYFTATTEKQRPDISFFWGYYILSISRPRKRILYPITITAKKGYVYISYNKISNIFVKRQHCHSFWTKQSQTPWAHESSTLYWIKLKPDLSVAQQGNPKSRALNVGYRIWFFEIPKIRILYPQNIPHQKRIWNILLADFWI